MNETEQELAASIYKAMMESMHESDRSAQAQRFRVGVSDIGFCSERLRRFLAREVPEETDMLAAFHGTWLGEGIEQAYKRKNPKAHIQSELTVRLEGDQGLFIIPGHPDIIDSEQDLLLDVKSANGLEAVRRSGFKDQQKRFQRHLYGSAAIAHGWLTPNCSVGNVWVDRSAQEHSLHVQIEPFDEMVIREATDWLDSVVYAWTNEETAMKEPPREVCKVACGFYETCRIFDTDVEGLISGPEALAAVQMHNESKALKARAKKLDSEVKGILSGVEGSTGEYLVRWTTVNESQVNYTRGAYERLSITKMKK